MHADPRDAVNIFIDTRCKRALAMHWVSPALLFFSPSPGDVGGEKERRAGFYGCLTRGCNKGTHSPHLAPPSHGGFSSSGDRRHEGGSHEAIPGCDVKCEELWALINWNVNWGYQIELQGLEFTPCFAFPSFSLFVSFSRLPCTFCFFASPLCQLS